MAPTEVKVDRRRARSRRALLDAALLCFQADGVRGTTIEGICEVADVAPRTFFNHFETREHLYAALAEERAGAFARALDDLADDPGPLAERLPAFLRVVGREMAAMPAYRELVGEMLRTRVAGGAPIARHGVLGRAATDFVRRGVAAGEVTSAHPPEVLADLLLGAVTTALTNWSVDDTVDLAGSLAAAGAALVDLYTPTEEGTR